MWYKNQWVRRRARRLHRSFPYVCMRDCIMSAAEDYEHLHPKSPV